MRKPKTGYKLARGLFGKHEKIPKEWQMLELGIISDGRPQYGSGDSALPYNSRAPRYVRITDITNDGKLKTTEMASVKLSNNAKNLLEKDDFLFARTGSVGRTLLFSKKFGKCVYAGYLIRFKLNKKKIFPEFLHYYTHSEKYWSWVHSTLTQGVQPNLNAQQYSKLPVVVPPLEEQQKIASILSGVDALIESTQETIEETERLKKGLMQRLLTKGIGHKKFKTVKGPKRIKIPSSWKFERVGNVCKIRKTGNTSSHLYVGLEHISQGKSVLNSRGNAHEFSTKNVFMKNDVLYGKLRPILNKVWLASESGYCSTDILPLTPTEKILPRILLFVLTSSNFFWYAVGTSAGTKMPRTNWSAIEKFAIGLPPLPEQQKIASILSGIDA